MYVPGPVPGPVECDYGRGQGDDFVVGSDASSNGLAVLGFGGDGRGLSADDGCPGHDRGGALTISVVSLATR